VELGVKSVFLARQFIEFGNNYVDAGIFLRDLNPPITGAVEFSISLEHRNTEDFSIFSFARSTFGDHEPAVPLRR
jgi:hypothetical protein